MRAVEVGKRAAWDTAASTREEAESADTKVVVEPLAAQAEGAAYPTPLGSSTWDTTSASSVVAPAQKHCCSPA